MAEENTLSTRTFLAELANLPAVADRVRLAALSQSHLISAARASGLGVEVARLTARHGEDSPEVQVVRQRLAIQTGLDVQIRAEIQRARIDPVAPKSGVFILHGLVFAEQIGIARVTVSAVDSEGNNLAYVCTDERGYFKLEVIDEREKQDTPLQVFLLVSDQGQAVLLQGDESFEFEPGRVFYRELVIGDFRREPCPEPPKVDILIVPDLDGLTQSMAEAALENAELTLGSIAPRSSPDRIDKVIEQIPAAGARVLAGTRIDLVIGIAETVKVPKVLDLELQEAKKAIEKNKLSLGEITQRAAPKVGIVLEQDPLADTEVEIETAVNLVVGKKGPILKDDIIDRIENDDAFPEIGASAQKLRQWFDFHGIDSMEKVAELKEKPDREIRDDFRLKNLKAVEVLKDVLGRLLGNE